MSRPAAASVRDFEPWLVGLLTATLVATPFLPSEQVTRGGGVLLILAMLVGLLGWALIQLQRGRTNLRLGATDLALAAMLGWHTLASVVQGGLGQPRASINVAWQWLAFGAVWFLTRQLIRTPAAVRAMVAVQLAMAVGLSTFGFFQVAYVMPRDRAEFARDPDGVLRAAGIVAPPGSPLRVQYANRLQSREPIATFALTNSLAGFLVPSLMLAAALIYSSAAPRRSDADTVLQSKPSATSAGDRPTSRTLAGFLLAGLMIAACIVLTKSRSAYVATAAGTALLVASAVLSRRRIGWKIPALAIAVTTVLIVVATALGLLDVQVLSEARKSLGYRFEYWQATLELMNDRPWLGCGPGNFQLAYAAYKLPQSSEMVADPHNFLLELAATAGLPALFAFGMALALWTGHIFRRKDSLTSSPVEGNAPESAQSPFADGATPRAIYWGAAAGVVFGFVAGTVGGMAPELSLVYTAVPMSGLVLWLLSDWVRRGTLTAPMIWIAVVALFVNLLAAGGIGFPAVAYGWWWLGALALNLGELAAAAAVSVATPTSTSLRSGGSRPFPRVPAWLGVGGLVVLTGMFFFTMYRPVISGRLELSLAAQAAESGRTKEALDHLLAAADLDPWSAEPRSQMAWVQQRIWLATRDSQALDAAMKAATEALARDQSHTLRIDLGSLFLQSFRQTGDRQSLELAGHLYGAANERYPNHAFGYAQWAWALQLSGQPAQRDAARAAARRALELDDKMPHAEQQLRNRQLIDFPPARPPDGQLPTRPAGRNAREYCESLVGGASQKDTSPSSVRQNDVSQNDVSQNAIGADNVSKRVASTRVVRESDADQRVVSENKGP